MIYPIKRNNLITAEECSYIFLKRRHMVTTLRLFDRLILLSTALGHRRLRLGRKVLTRNRYWSYDFCISQKQEDAIFNNDHLDYWIDLLESKGYTVEANYFTKYMEIKW